MRYLSFDLRALALMRIAIALVLVFDLSIRLTDLEAFYSNMGVVPLSMLFEYAWNPYFISIHAISGLWQVQLLLFLFAYLCALFLLVGYRTQLFTLLSWFLLLSLHNRNSLILQGGDDMLRMVLFWGIFIPWGRFYSYDRLLAPEREQDTSISSIATIAYLLQVCLLYTGSALLKGDEWSKEFTAVYYAYSLDQIAYPITRYLYPHYELLAWLTRVAYYFELLIPGLFLLPIKHALFRAIGVVLIIGFHLCNEFTLLIGLFPSIGIATSLGLLPSFVMDGIDRWVFPLQSKHAPLLKRFYDKVLSYVPWRSPRRMEDSPFKYVKTAFMAFLLVFVLDWNLSNLTFVHSKLGDHLRCIGYALRLDQHWGMFAPSVFKDDGWYILEGILENGKRISLLRPQEKLHYKKPPHIVRMFKNDRWRKYFENLLMVDHSFMRGFFCNYSQRKWEEAHPNYRLRSLRIIYMKEKTLPNYYYSKPSMTVLWQCEK